MDEAFIGSVFLFSGTYAPRGWAFCNGQQMAINNNQALYSIIGTTYGGDGINYFTLPDLRGRVAVHAGQAPALQPVALGQKLGTNTNSLTASQMSSHSHTLYANATLSGRNVKLLPTNNFVCQNQDGTGNFAPTADVEMNTASVGISGQNQPVNNMQPSLGLNYIICLEGIYPPRS
ncbi:phage tail protein [Geofilum sp. OHC36d9]|uniref:phage tail protein n=1 Tax=Geofilum sp. OHC36d9 TaxID=3458413 RepID=UPI0040349B55